MKEEIKKFSSENGLLYTDDSRDQREVVNDAVEDICNHMEDTSSGSCEPRSSMGAEDPSETGVSCEPRSSMGAADPSETGVVGVTVGGGELMEEDLGGGATIGASKSVEDVTMLEKYGISRKDESKLLRELVNKYNKKGILSTTNKSGNYSTMKFLQIPIVKAKSLKKKKEKCAELLSSDSSFMHKIISIFSNEEKDMFGAQFIASFLGTNFCADFIEGAKRVGLCVGEKMSPQLTSAMWAESGVHEKSKQRIIASYVRSYLGQSLFSSEKVISKLRKENILADRTYGETIHEKVVTVEAKGLGDILTKQHTPK